MLSTYRAFYRLAARPYAVELARVLRSTMARIESPEHPLLAVRPENNILVIVLTGERGLAGAFNSNVLRKAHEFFRGHQGQKITTIPVGKKGRDSWRRAGSNWRPRRSASRSHDGTLRPSVAIAGAPVRVEPANGGTPSTARDSATQKLN